MVKQTSVLILVIVLLQACSPETSQDKDWPVQLSYRLLWDPASPELHDWQLLGNTVRDLIAGEEGELFVSDTSNARVIHFTTNGELIGVIGQKGGGPGEFAWPGDLAYDKERKLLWVGERGRRRISRFSRNDNSFEFNDAIASRAFMIDRFPSLVLDEENYYWTNGWYMGNEVSSNTLIQLTQSDGTIIRSFGQIWEPEGTNPGMIPRVNEGSLLKIRDDRLAFIWLLQPRIEIWRTDGTVILDKYFDTPEVRRRPGPSPIENEAGRMSYPAYFMNAAFNKNTDLLYVGFNEDDQEYFNIYGLHSNTLDIIEWYQLHLDELDGRKLFPQRLVVDMINESIRFFCIDGRNSGVLVLEPK